MIEVSLEGPVEDENGKLTIRIPLAAGGDSLAPLAHGIGEVQGEDLIVVIQPWLAEKLRIGAGSLVVVDNLEGKFRITRSDANDEGWAEGPVELLNGELVLRIPFSAFGEKLVPVAGEMGKVEGEYLVVTILPRLAEELRIGAGSRVRVPVDNHYRKLTIIPCAAEDASGTESE